MQLLELPPELLVLILYHCSTPSFVQVARTCGTLFTIASSSRGVLLHHLRWIPGIELGVEDLRTKDLSLLLRRRAASQLYGANFHADQATHTFHGVPIDTRASAVRATGNPNVAIVPKGGQRIYLYHASSGSILSQEVIEPVFQYPGKAEIIMTVFSGENMISVLQRYIPEPASDISESEHPFVEEAMRPYRKESVQLVHYHRNSPTEKFSHATFSAFPEQEGYHPLSIAVANQYLVAISWQNVLNLDDRMVAIHTAPQDASFDQKSISYLRYSTLVILDEDGLAPTAIPSRRNSIPKDVEPIVRMSFNDQNGQLLYYHPASPIYGCYQNLSVDSSSPYGTSHLMSNTCRVDFSDDLVLEFSIAIPFFCTHNSFMANPGQHICQWKYLALGIARHPEENWTVACLLRSEAHCRYIHCGHIQNLDRGRRFGDWTIVARLWGYRTGDNSLCGLVTTSRSSTRLAIAVWKTIYIWPLEPLELLEGNVSGFYPTNMVSSEGMVELKPVVLKPDAVCFSLKFTNEDDELIALTDRGLMCWNLGPSSNGRKECVTLGIPRAIEDEEKGEVQYCARNEMV